ncbi:MAG: diguanylate cyclase, partial [Gallionellaceae bacterium]
MLRCLLRIHRIRQRRGLSLHERLKRILSILLSKQWQMEEHSGAIFLTHGEELWLTASFRWSAGEKKRCLSINVGDCINGGTKLIAEKIFSAFQPSEQCTQVSMEARFLSALIMDGKQCLGAIYLNMTPGHVLTNEFKRLFYKTVNILSDLLLQEFARYKLEDSEAKYRLLTNNTPMGILIHIDGAVAYLNKTMCTMLGAQSSEEVIGHQLVDFIVPSEQEETHYAAGLLQGSPLEVSEDRLFRLDGSCFWAEVRSVATEFNDQPAVQVHIDNIDTRKKAVEDLARLSYYDELTDLPNRRLFSDRVEQAIAMARREKYKLALLYLDLNRFKTINDTLGHSHGDLVLKEVGRRLNALIRPSDTTARMGGDEFAVLISGGGVTDKVATQVAYKLSEAIKEPFQLGEQQFVLDVSIGIAIFPRDGETMDILFKHADTAMYSAKRSETSVHYFSSEMETQAMRRLMLEQELAKITDIYRRRSNRRTKNSNKGQPPFQLKYQAKHRLSDNAVIGVEALIRWQHAELGSISPAEFIPLAEEMGLMRPITYAILAEAAKQAVILEAANIRPPHIGINLSAIQLIQVDLVQDILFQIKKAGA